MVKFANPVGHFNMLKWFSERNSYRYGVVLELHLAKRRRRSGGGSGVATSHKFCSTISYNPSLLMPSILQASEKVDSFPNLYASPFGNDGIIPLYSSIPIPNNNNGDCLPCVVCGNSKTRHEIIQQQSLAYRSLTGDRVDVVTG